MNRIWSQKEEKRLIELHEKGMTFEAISQLLHRTPSSCASHLKEKSVIYHRRCLNSDCRKKFDTTEKGKYFCRESHKIKDDTGILGSSGASFGYVSRARKET